MEGLEILKKIGYDNIYITKTEIWIAEELYKLAEKKQLTIPVVVDSEAELCDHPSNKIRHVEGRKWECECGYTFRY